MGSRALRQPARSRQARTHRYSRVPGHVVRTRIVEGFSGARAGGDSKLVQMAGAHGKAGPQRGIAGGDAEATETSAPCAVDRADESRGRVGGEGCSELAGAGRRDSRVAVWLWDSQC